MDELRYEIQMERDIIAKMRDGVVLRADVFPPHRGRTLPRNHAADPV
jgi:predicted acyl esterase